MPLLRATLAASVALAISAGAVAAQPSTAPAPVATESFLEQRVIEELAADGIVLSRLGVVLDLQLVGSLVVVSLVEARTSRALASTKLDALPGDRDSAVATVTPVVANLVSQIASGPPSNDHVELERLRVLEETQREMLARAERDRLVAEQRLAAERAERERVAIAEQTYRAEAIGFGKDFDVWVSKDGAWVNKKWTAHRGDAEIPLGATDFYRAVDRPDLAERYQRRKVGGSVALVGGSLVMLAGAAIMLQTREVDVAGYYTYDDHPYVKQGSVVAGIGVVIGLVGAVFVMNPHPVSEGEARQLGAARNRKLREQLGLPVPPAPTALRDVRVAPFVTATSGGLGLSARF